MVIFMNMFQACFSVFQINLLKNLLDHACKMHVVLIFDICNVYELLLMIGCIQYWVKMVHVALKFLRNIEDWRLFLVC